MKLQPHYYESLSQATLGDPFKCLGVHQVGDKAAMVRIWRPGMTAVTVRFQNPTRFPDTPAYELAMVAPGLFEIEVELNEKPKRIFCHGITSIGKEYDWVDPYGFYLLISDWDLERFREGHHHNIDEILGAQVVKHAGVKGVRFAVWAPSAERVSVVGEWNHFDGRVHPMRLRHPYGVWEIFIPEAKAGQRYKFEIRSRSGDILLKADPYAQAASVPPQTDSIVAQVATHEWQDHAWLERRQQRKQHESAQEWNSQALAIYEVHIGSWRSDDDGNILSYRSLAPQLIAHCQKCGFNAVEFLPLAQHPYEGSWGYQVTGQFAPNSRHGSADDLRWLIDQLHQAEIAVLVDFVPGHFPKDVWSLVQYDGHPCYEYHDPREGEHREWGTHVFNYRRPEVRNFLIGAALHWLRSYHIDGLRVDAVSSMLYRNYDRKDGEWIANEHGGKENLEAVNFLQELTSTVHSTHPGVLMIAEESTAWPDITKSTTEEGLGFDWKWNMGWMHDSLRYFAQDPVMRPGCHDWITFHQWYAYDEKWVLPLSHDEIVHGKGSLIDKLPGDYHARLAQLRLLHAWQVAVPGKPLLFMGSEFGAGREWDWQRPLDWGEAQLDERQAMMRCLSAWLSAYKSYPALHQADHERHGFRWVDSDNRQESILAFLRQSHPDDQGQYDQALVVVNFTPVERNSYPVCVPQAGQWEVIINSDRAYYGGADLGTPEHSKLAPTGEQRDTWAGVIEVDIPPLAALLLRPVQ